MTHLVHHICDARGHYIPSETVTTDPCGCEHYAATCPFDGRRATGIRRCAACRWDANAERGWGVAV